MVYRKDAEGRYVFVNSRFCQMKGLPIDQILGQKPAAFNPAEKAAQFMQEHAHIMSTGKSIELEESLSEPGGATRHFHVVKLPVIAADGKIVGSQGVHFDITQRKKAEAELAKVHRELLDASRRAGMAEVATGVLHNVGNVLNSVNVSASVIAAQLKKSKMPYLALATGLLKEHAADLGNFITIDPKGKQLPGYFIGLAEQLAAEQTAMLAEANSLQKNIEHIKDIVSTQQSYAKAAGMNERVKVIEIVEDSLRMNEDSLERHDVRITKKYADALPDIIVDRHKVIQILVNLIRNAQFACEESPAEDRQIVVSITRDTERVRICVQDNGVGIPPENLTRIFNHGFTTRKNGHGFGLHSGALAAKEMRGALIAQSDGPGKGASFTLELPLQPPKPTQDRRTS
jgi:PAS domain S-box-containing protein